LKLKFKKETDNSAKENMTEIRSEHSLLFKYSRGSEENYKNLIWRNYIFCDGNPAQARENALSML
jgi:hypothetical protein